MLFRNDGNKSMRTGAAVGAHYRYHDDGVRSSLRRCGRGGGRESPGRHGVVVCLLRCVPTERLFSFFNSRKDNNRACVAMATHTQQKTNRTKKSMALSPKINTRIDDPLPRNNSPFSPVTIRGIFSRKLASGCSIGRAPCRYSTETDDFDHFSWVSHFHARPPLSLSLPVFPPHPLLFISFNILEGAHLWSVMPTILYTTWAGQTVLGFSE